MVLHRRVEKSCQSVGAQLKVVYQIQAKRVGSLLGLSALHQVGRVCPAAAVVVKIGRLQQATKRFCCLHDKVLRWMSSGAVVLVEVLSRVGEEEQRRVTGQ